MSIAVMADDTTDFSVTATSRRASVTRMVQRRRSVMTHVEHALMDDVDHDQSMLSKQCSVCEIIFETSRHIVRT